MKQSILSILFLSLIFVSCKKQPDYTKFTLDYSNFIEKAITAFETKHGLSLAIVKDDQIIFEKYHGLADVEKKVLVDENTCFYIASSTKSFTALATLILDSKGKLDLNKSVSDYFPEINFAPELKTDSITIHHLIQHTSGIQNWPMINATAYTGVHNSELLLAQLEKYTRIDKRAPFGEFRYTNLGYNILGMIMNRELGQDWQSILDDEIFKPLNMGLTSARMTTANNNGWHVAKPHSQVNDGNVLERLYLEKQDNTMHPAGGIISTPRDMSKWLIMELNNGKLDGKQIYDANMIENSRFPHATQNRSYDNLKRFGYGYGWNLATTPLGDTLVHHFGGFSGTHAEVSLMPSTGVGVIMMTNENGSGSDLSFLLASYAFDYFAGRADLETYYDQKLNDYVQGILDWKKSIKKHKADRAKRKWQLELPHQAYAGTYKSELFGTLEIKYIGDNQLTAQVGNLKSPAAEPYVDKNSIRVEMKPRSGSAIHFTLEKGKVVKANWDGLTYTKKTD
ncbi:MAG: serine hydrolase [Flavobacteriaceae bacterium]|nr:serine hydrolase [Flavobacteriaceae bacterium]